MNREPKYKIGDEVKDTQAFGDVKIIDLFRSVTKPELFAYMVHDFESGAHTLCSEEELKQF